MVGGGSGVGGALLLLEQLDNDALVRGCVGKDLMSPGGPGVSECGSGRLSNERVCCMCKCCVCVCVWSCEYAYE